MSVATRDMDPAFQGAGQKEGLEVWHIENLQPVALPKSFHGKFFAADSYVILKTIVLKNSSLLHDIHYWLGKDTSQDEASTASIKTVLLNACIGGCAVQYREPQGNETDKFLSYFRPCFIPQQTESKRDRDSYETRLYVCKGKHVVHIKEVPFARSSLNHDGVFILDTRSKIFQFNGSSMSTQDRAKALEVVQYIKNTYHGGKCEVAVVEDGRLMADADAGDFWALFGGFAPLGKKATSKEAREAEPNSMKLFCVVKGQATSVDFDALKRKLLDTNNCYLLDCGTEVYVWFGKNTSFQERKSTIYAAEERIITSDRPTCHIISFVEGFETVMFRSKFQTWPKAGGKAAPEAGKSKVADLLKRQGLNVRGLEKAVDTPKEEEPQPYIDISGSLQVWRVNGQEKVILSAIDQSSFYSGDCYIFEYAYSGQNREEYLVGSWFGRNSVKEDRTATLCHTRRMIESVKSQAAQVRLYEGKELAQFFSIFQILIVYKGGLSCGYKNFIAENNLRDDTYSETGLALFRLQGFVPDSMRAIQVQPAASSLNSCYCYIMHNKTTVFTWTGTLSAKEDQELLERMLDHIKPNSKPKIVKEGEESPLFWGLLGGKVDYPGKKILMEAECDPPHLFSCNFSKGNLKVTEVFSFCQDDLMTESLLILDCRSVIFVWVGELVDSKIKMNTLSIGEEFLKRDFLLEDLSDETPIYIVTEGNEPLFFTRFFNWNSSKAAMHGNSYERKLTIMKTGGTRSIEKSKRRIPTHSGRICVQDKQRSRCMSFSPDKLHTRGRSPSFNALTACFENPVITRNLSTPPPALTTLLPESTPSEAPRKVSRSASFTSLTEFFESAKEDTEPKLSRKGSLKCTAAGGNPNATSNQSTLSRGGGRRKSIDALLPGIHDANDGEEEDRVKLPIYPYERLKTTSSDPVSGIDITMREAYLSSTEFREKFLMTRSGFNKLPKWRQYKLKIAVHLF